MTVLLEATLYMPEIEIRPDTRTVCDVLELSADLSAEAVVTVTTVDDEPPLVPPFMLAKPTGLDSAAHTGAWVATASPPAARTPADRAERTVLRVDMGDPPLGDGCRPGWRQWGWTAPTLAWGMATGARPDRWVRPYAAGKRFPRVTVSAAIELCQ
ncbi:hypothetical protein Q0Z83_018370 [Actinoplanes sichuanensis]|nr:hypothetical protein Q0Z83_018370 [Actinoplanes sichuanensis]